VNNCSMKGKPSTDSATDFHALLFEREMEGGVPLTEVVLDSGAVISGSSFQSLGTDVRYVTVPNVIAEIKDKRSRMLLESFPFKLQLQTPSAAAMKAVCDFARLCGEFHELSVTDLEVMALSYQLEVEKNGMKNIRTVPAGTKNAPVEKKEVEAPVFVEEQPKKVAVPNTVWGGKSSISFADMLKKAPEAPAVVVASSEGVESEGESTDSDGESWVEGEEVEEQYSEVTGEEDDANSLVDGEEIEEEDIEEFVAEMVRQKLEKTSIVEVDREAEQELKESVDEVAEGAIEKISEFRPISDLKDVCDDRSEVASTSTRQTQQHKNPGFEGHWITPENVDFQQEGTWGISGKQIQKRKRKLPRSMKTPVACMTTDYGMQNVMAQMGLRLLTIDGRTLHKIRHWALGCFGCREICNDLSREFCPGCGGHTLVRVGVDSNPHTGEIRYHWNKRRLTTARRGVKYSIPKPKHGRNANNIILREDELNQARAKRGRPGSKNHSVDEWTDKGLEFNVLIGTSTRKNSDISYGHRRRNPNEVAKKTGNKKKRR
jgi:RNA-binding protein NOB1